MTKKKPEEDYRRYLALVSVPFVLIAAPICGYFIGAWLDGYFNTEPYLSFILLAIGVFAAVREFLKIVREFTNRE